MGRGAWIVLSVLELLGAAMTVSLWFLSLFLFDSPGSENNPWVWALFVALRAMTPLFVLGAVLPWLLRKRPWAGRLFMLPALGIMVLMLCVMALNAACGGQFSCP